MWFIVTLFALSLTPLAILVTYPTIAKYSQIAYVSIGQHKVDKTYDQLTLILASMITDDWSINAKTAKYPKEGSYRFFVDLSDKIVRIPGDTSIPLSNYWLSKYSSYMSDIMSKQAQDTVLRHLFPDGKLKLLK